MKCNEFEALWIGRLDGRLSGAEAARLDAHAAGCAPCRRLVTELEKLEVRLESLSEEPAEPPPYLAARIRARLGEVPRRRGWLGGWALRPLFSARWLLVCTTASLAFFAGLLAREVYRLNEWFRSSSHLQQVVLEFPGAGAEDVRLVGDFNGWGRSPGPVRAQRLEDRWVFRVELAPGRYQYAFLVDGKTWLPDPEAPSMIPDGFGGSNSLLYVHGRGESQSL